MAPPPRAGAMDNTRCSRADCIALREELELLRGDLDELESENDQLHERLAQVEGEVTTQTAQTNAAWHAQVAEKDREVAALKQRIGEMERQSPSRVKQVEPTQQAALNSELATLRTENAALTQHVRDLETRLAREESASASACAAVAVIEQEKTSKHDALYEVLKENETLRREMSDLQDALKRISEVALEYETAMKGLHAQHRELQEAVEDQTLEITQLQTRLQQAEQEKQRVEAQLVLLDAQETDDDMSRGQRETELSTLRRQVELLKRQLADAQALRMVDHQPVSSLLAARDVDNESTVQVEAMDQQVQQLHELRVRDQFTIQQLTQTITQQQMDLETLAGQLESVTETTKHAKRSGSGHQGPQNIDPERLQRENAMLHARIQEQRALMQEVEDGKVKLERELADVRAWNAKYEAHAGLEDIMSFQKKLRQELEVQQATAQHLREELNDQREATSKWQLAFKRLREQAGGVNVDLDDLSLSAELQGVLAEQQAVIAHLEKQLSDGEEERVRLLQQAREQARQVGGTLFQTYGMTPEQWKHVETFITCLKQTPESAQRWLGVSSSEIHPDRDELVKEIERLKQEIQHMIQERNAAEAQRAIQERDASSVELVTEEEGDTAIAPQLVEPEEAKVRVEEIVRIKTQREVGKRHRSASSQTSPRTHQATPRARESPISPGSQALPPTQALLSSQALPASQASPASQGLPASPRTLAEAIAEVLASRIPQLQATSPANNLATPVVTKTQAVDTTLAFASEVEYRHDIDALHELSRVMDAYVDLEAQHEHVQDQLATHSHAFQALLDQQAVLYQHLFAVIDEAAMERMQAQHSLQQSQHDRRVLQHKCERLEASLHTIEASDTPAALNSGGAETRLKAEVSSLTRQVAELEVQRAQYQRERKLLMDAQQWALTDRQDCEQQWLDMETALKCRVLFLERWKAGAEDRISRMEQTLDRCVLKRVADQQQQHIEAVVAQFAETREAFIALHLQCVEKTARGQPLAEAMPSGANMDISALPVAVSATPEPGDAEALKQENALLYERIAEVEQLFAQLTRECASYREMAALAATQAQTLATRLTQQQAITHEYDEHLVQLQSASEDHAIVARLQQHVLQLKTTYQRFAVKYSRAVDAQQRAILQCEHAERSWETQLQQSSESHAQLHQQTVVLDAALRELKLRDMKRQQQHWDAVETRLVTLERDLEHEHARRRESERQLEARQKELLPSMAGSGSDADMSSRDIQRMQCRIEALETRERVLLAQVEALAPQDRVAKEHQEEAQRLRVQLEQAAKLQADLVKQVEELQQRIAAQLQQQSKLEVEKRALQRTQEEWELQCQQLQMQLQCTTAGSNNQLPQDAESRSNSPLMRKKVGLYEKDQAELQSAAQATIASLKLLVEEKNALVAEYQAKLAEQRTNVAAQRAQERVETTQRNKKLKDDQQQLIAQLKDAMSTLRHTDTTGKQNTALLAAQERQEQILRDWKRAEMELQRLQEAKRGVELDLEGVRNERDLAEARAGEALEEIVLLQEAKQALEREKQTLEQQIVTVQHSVAQRANKMQLLREALVQLKEEFIKAEDRHAIEVAKLQQTMNSQALAQRKSERAEENSQWKEDKSRLEAQVQILQEKLQLMQEELKRTKRVQKKEQHQRQRQATAEAKERNPNAEDTSGASTVVLEAEIARLKRALQDKVVSESRVVDDLEKKIRVLTAQNQALRESATTPALEQEEAKPKSRAQWETEKKLQRRVEMLTLRLNEQRTLLEQREKDRERLQQRVSALEQECQRISAAKSNDDASTSAEVISDTEKTGKREWRALIQHISTLEDTLARKREEWQAAMQTQMDEHERQVGRLRARLGKLTASGAVENDTASVEASLVAEERACLARHEAEEELAVLGALVRDKERALVDRDTQILQLQLELESQRVDAARHTTMTTPIGGGSRERLAQTKEQGKQRPSSGKDRLVLEDVIENMKRVIERLRSENEALKRHRSLDSSDRIESLRRKLQAAKDENKSLQVEVAALRSELATVKQDKLRLQQRVRLLSASSNRRASETTASAPTHNDEEARALQAQISELQDAIRQKDMDLARLEQEVLEMQETQAATQDGHDQAGALTIQHLEEENAALREELSAFDDAFFEEIEDLKYKYAQALRDKQQLERQLRRMSMS